MNDHSIDQIHTAVMPDRSIDAFDFIFQTAHTRPEYIDQRGLRTLYYQTKHFLKEIDQIAAHIHNINYTSKDEIFVFDFDIIYSSINWLNRKFESDEVKSRNTFWASTAVELFRNQTFLLPGAAVELISFLRYNERRSNPGHLTSHMATHFVDEFLLHLSPEKSASEEFYDALRSLRSVNLMADTLFVAKEILESHRAHPYVKARFEFPYSEDCYQDTFDYMMRKRKRQKPINTTIDATNYAIVNHLNMDTDAIEKTDLIPAQSSHTIISNTRSLQDIPAYISTREQERFDLLPDENGVASPRQAVIYKLISQAAKDPYHAEEIALEWAIHIRGFRDQIRDVLSKNRATNQFKTSSLVNIDGITSLIWSFDAIQRRISEIRKTRKSRLDAFKKSFHADEISVFTADIVDYFNRVISNTDIFKKVKSAYNDGNMDRDSFNIIDFDKQVLDDFGLKAGFSLVSGKNTYNFADDARGIRLWSTLEGVDKALFVERSVELTQRLANILLREKKQVKEIYGDVALSGFQGGQWVLIKEGKVHEVSSRVVEPLSLAELNENLGFDAVTADLIRYECQFYAIATNGRKFTFRSNEMLTDELLREAEGIVKEDKVSFTAPEVRQKIHELMPA